MSLLAPTLQAFFTDRLIGQWLDSWDMQVSSLVARSAPVRNTIAAYRDTIRMLLAFAASRPARRPATSTSKTSERR